MEAGLSRVVLEVDNIHFYNYRQKGKREKSVFGFVVNDILQLAEQCREIRFSHVGRQGNRVAHILAQHNRDYDDLRVWMEEVSPVLYPFSQNIPSFRLSAFLKDLHSFTLFLIWNFIFAFLPSHVSIIWSTITLLIQLYSLSLYYFTHPTPHTN